MKLRKNRTMQTKEHDPAFPQDDYFDEQLTGQIPGLTKREYFAGQALQGLLASPKPLPDGAEDIAVMMADALIKSLNK